MHVAMSIYMCAYTCVVVLRTLRLVQRPLLSEASLGSDFPHQVMLESLVLGLARLAWCW
jgi:hypothetical protein